MNAFIMTDEQILELGFKALVDKLGPVGMTRFIHQFEAGTDNFTEDRRQWLGVSDVETLVKQIQETEYNTGYTVNDLDPVIEQELDDIEVYSPRARVWLDMQKWEDTEYDLTASGNMEMFCIGGQMQTLSVQTVR